MAFRAYEPSKLQIYSCVSRIQQILIDGIIVGILMTTYQIIGVCVLGVLWILEGLRHCGLLEIKQPEIKR